MPGRLEFEHEVENDAEMAVKDLEFARVWRYGGDEQPESKPVVVVDEEIPEEDEAEKDGEVKSGEEVKVKLEQGVEAGKVEEVDTKPDIQALENGTNVDPGKNGEKGKEESGELEVEDEDELDVKLALMDIYFSKLDKREEAKEIIFDRGLTDHKRVSSNPVLLMKIELTCIDTSDGS